MKRQTAQAYAPLFPELPLQKNAVLAPGELIVVNFAGGGGASEGIARAMKRPPNIAINHDAKALSMHRVNAPYTTHYIEDVWHVDPREATAGRPVGLAQFSPDCFPAGTLVLTERGYVSIETVEVGERVLTHAGNWKRVTKVMSTRRPLMTIRGHGHPGLAVSPEHPFYVRHGKKGKPTWAPASTLGKGHYWATPTSFGVKCLQAPPVEGRGLRFDERLLWLVGQYISNGWTRLTDDRAELVITTGKHKADALREKLNRWQRRGERSGEGELAWHGRETETAYQFSTNHRGLVEWLRGNFGHLAEHKSLPGWAYQLPAHLREELLSGYLEGDGHSHGNIQECSTVSKALAFSIKSLAESLGKTATVFLGTNPDNIQGRPVNAKPIYQVRWRHELKRMQTVRHAGLEWAPIREVTVPEGEETVYNISVQDDESYVVEGIVVHNCTHFSIARGSAPRSPRVRGLAWVALRWAATVQPRVIIVENVSEFTTWGPLDRHGQVIESQKGRTYRSFLNALERQGYVVESRNLRACDYGAGTTRERYFLVARRDGLPIVWPEPTHAAPDDPRVLAGQLQAWPVAADHIDWRYLISDPASRTAPSRSLG